MHEWKWQHTKTWVAAKAVPRGKFIAVNAYIKNEKSEINTPTLWLKELEKDEVNEKQAEGDK